MCSFVGASLDDALPKKGFDKRNPYMEHQTRVYASAASRQAAQDRRRLFRTKFAPHSEGSINNIGLRGHSPLWDAMKIELLAITPNAEEVIEFAGRICYRSEGKRGPGTAAKLIGKLIAMGHESPLEHASATFHISGCSRAMTHQLVRHRLMSVSQESQRYVDEKSFAYVAPPSIPDGKKEEFERDMETLREMYVKWKAQGLKNEDARFVLPNACTSEIVVSANLREFRHIFQVRCSPQAQWEIREACAAMLRELHRRVPSVFQDLMSLLENKKCRDR